MAIDDFILHEIPSDALLHFNAEIDSLGDPRVHTSADSLMEASVNAMSTLCNLAKIASSVSPTRQRGFRKRNAPIVGLFMRVIKCYEGFLRETASRRGDTAWIFIRPIIESYVNCAYLIGAGASSSAEFIKCGLKPEKEAIMRIRGNATGRRLWPIERRMLGSMRRYVRMAGMTIDELQKRKQWQLDGKNVRDLMKELGLEPYYAFLFGNASHFVHGSWVDLYMNHLYRERNVYFPQLWHSEPDARVSPAISNMVADLVLRYLRRFRSSRTRPLVAPITRLMEFFVSLDSAVELHVQRTRSRPD